MVNQVFVRTLDGTSLCLQLDAGSVTVGEILDLAIRSSSQIPSSDLLVYTGTKVLPPDSLLLADESGFFPSCHLSGRLRGGKGGFGSLLRGAATRAGQKKTSNFDACRDMSGRRLRHVNAEKKLKEWRHEAKERNLEKVALDHIKKLAKEKRKAEKEGRVTVEVKARSEETMDRVAESVKLGLQSSKRMSELEKKRKRALLVDDEDEDGEKKGAKKLLGLELGSVAEEEEDDEESSTSDEESEEEESEEDESEEEEEDEEGDEARGDGSDSSKGMGEKESTKGKATGKDEEESKTGPEGEANASAAASCSEPPCTLAQESSGKERQRGHTMSSLKHMGVPASLTSSSADEPSASGSDTGSGSASPETISVSGRSAVKTPVTDSSGIMCDGSIVWDKVSRAADLEVLGLDLLKAELQKNGLKCGGTLQERAARVFLLKDTPVEKMDKKLLAKPASRK